LVVAGAGGIAGIVVALANDPGIIGREVRLAHGGHVGLTHLGTLAQHLLTKLAELLDPFREDPRLADIGALAIDAPAAVVPRSAF
jgi:hypothetical protein